VNSKAPTGKLDWYARRCKIQSYHKVLKSGCQAERSRLRTAERLTNPLAVLCVVAWWVFWLTRLSAKGAKSHLSFLLRASVRRHEWH
jgi:hypothetical protein